MGSVGGGEILVILLVALIVLGPDKLPEAARKVGSAMSELRRISTSFQNELKSAAMMDDENVEARARLRGEAAIADAKAKNTSNGTDASTDASTEVDANAATSAGTPIEGDTEPFVNTTPETEADNPAAIESDS